MRTSAEQYLNNSGLIDKKIGELYETLELIKTNLTELRHVSFYMPQLFEIHGNLDDLLKLSSSDDAINFTNDNIGALATYFDNLNTLITNRASLDALADEIETNAELADDYANADEDIEIETGKFSSKHYAIKASETQALISTLKTDTEAAVQLLVDAAETAKDAAETAKDAAVQLLVDAAEEIRNDLASLPVIKVPFDATETPKERRIRLQGIMDANKSNSDAPPYFAGQHTTSKRILIQQGQWDIDRDVFVYGSTYVEGEGIGTQFRLMQTDMDAAIVATDLTAARDRIFTLASSAGTTRYGQGKLSKMSFWSDVSGIAAIRPDAGGADGKTSLTQLLNSEFEDIFFFADNGIIVDNNVYTQRMTIKRLFGGDPELDQMVYFRGNDNTIEGCDKEGFATAATGNKPYIQAEGANVGGLQPTSGNRFLDNLIEGGLSVLKPMIGITDGAGNSIDSSWHEGAEGFLVDLLRCDDTYINGQSRTTTGIKVRECSNTHIEVLKTTVGESSFTFMGLDVDAGSDVCIGTFVGWRGSNPYPHRNAFGKNIKVINFVYRNQSRNPTPGVAPISQVSMKRGGNLFKNPDLLRGLNDWNISAAVFESQYISDSTNGKATELSFGATTNGFIRQSVPITGNNFGTPITISGSVKVVGHTTPGTAWVYPYGSGAGVTETSGLQRCYDNAGWQSFEITFVPTGGGTFYGGLRCAAFDATTRLHVADLKMSFGEGGRQGGDSFIDTLQVGKDNPMTVFSSNTAPTSSIMQTSEVGFVLHADKAVDEAFAWFWDGTAAVPLYSGVPNTDLSATHSLDVPALTDGSTYDFTVTVTGAALGDFAQVSQSINNQKITMEAYVTNINTVSVRLTNNSGGTINHGLSDFYILVKKR